MKIAVTAWRTEGPWNAGTLCAQVERAETMGFHSYWLPENHFGDQRAIPSPLTLLAAAAARTQDIKLGTTSYLLPIRHPVQAAEEVAVVDQLSGGRLILGLGRGIQGSVFDVFGVPGREKRKRFESNLDCMIRAWKGAPLHTENGDEGVCLAPLPVQKPHPPLWVAAFGPLALKQAGGLGLPYLCSPIEPLAMLKSNYALHREATKQAGHAPAEVVPVMRTILVTDNAALAKRVSGQLANSAPRQLQGEDVSVDEWAIVGDRHYARDRLAEYAEQLGITHLIGGGRLPRLEEVEQLHSQQHLLEIAESL